MLSLEISTKTLWHRWPAGLKLGLLCCVTMVLFVIHDLWFHIGSLAFVLMLYAIGGKQFLLLGVKGLKPLWFFLLVIIVWHGFNGAYQQGAVVAVRLLTVFGFANLITMTTKLADMIDVLKWLLTPLRALGFSTQPLEIAIALVIRFLPVFLDHSYQLIGAWRARAISKPRWPIVLPIVLAAVDDAEHVSEALKARFCALK